MKFIEDIVEQYIDKPYANEKFRPNGSLDKLRRMIRDRGEFANEQKSKPVGK